HAILNLKFIFAMIIQYSHLNLMNLMKPIKRFFTDPHKSYFLFGPRGTGKSTLVKQLYPEAVLIDLLDPQTFRSFRAYPERLIELVKAHSNTAVFIIDEIQKAPDLLSVVHKLIEEKMGWKFVLTGSSARKLKRAGVDLLAGRAQLKHLHPFMAAGFEEEFDLKKGLEYCFFSLIFELGEAQGGFKEDCALLMKRKGEDEGIVRNIEQFGRFLQAISFSQASILNYTNIARECAVSGKTVENYVSILEDLLLAFKIQIFNKKAQRQLSSHPKFYFFDLGVYQ